MVATDRVKYSMSSSLAAPSMDLQTTLQIKLIAVSKIFVVHKEKVCTAIPSFQEVLEKSSEFTQHGIIEINDLIDYSSMAVMIEWVYTGKLALRNPKLDQDDDKNTKVRRRELTDVYFVARGFKALNLQNDVIDEFRVLSKKRRMECSLLERVVGCCSVDCGLARYMIDDIAELLSRKPDAYNDEESKWSKNFRELIERIPPLGIAIFSATMDLNAQKVPTPDKQPVKYYHDLVAVDVSMDEDSDTDDEDDSSEDDE